MLMTFNIISSLLSFKSLSPEFQKLVTKVSWKLHQVISQAPKAHVQDQSFYLPPSLLLWHPFPSSNSIQKLRLSLPYFFYRSSHHGL